MHHVGCKGKRIVFDFFKKSEYIVPESTEVPVQVPEVNIYEPAPYTIGVNKHGMTQVTFRSNAGQHTLSMDARAVRHFIKMLECALEEVSEEE